MEQDTEQSEYTIYLLHFSRPLGHAKHYLGTTRNLPARLAAHEAGTGATITRVAGLRGITWEVVRTWPGGRDYERCLKRQGGRSRMCPLCKAEHLAACRRRYAQRRASRCV